MVTSADASVRPRYVAAFIRASGSRVRGSARSRYVAEAERRVIVGPHPFSSNSLVSNSLLCEKLCPPTALKIDLKMPLNLPGSSTSTLVTSAAPTGTNTGIDKLDPRFLALLQQNEVAPEHMDALGLAGCKTMALYGHCGSTEERLEKFLKATLGLDVDARVTDAIPIAQLTIVWSACRKRQEVETEAQAQRAANHLPPQLTVEDQASAREALEKKLSKQVPDHKVPSESYFQKKVGEVETVWQAEKLSEVTNLAQELKQKKPRSQTDQHLGVNSKLQLVAETKLPVFTVPMPTDEATFKNRFEIMDNMTHMLQMRFIGNPVLATYEKGMWVEYCSDFLCG